jgi:hypothetical protein
LGNQTAISDFGHFCAEVPKSLHIGAYPRVLLIEGGLPRCYESPASGDIRCPLVSETGVIAMQKVEGSNPISRFASIPLHFGRLAFPGKIKPPPHIASRPMHQLGYP